MNIAKPITRFISFCDVLNKKGVNMTEIREPFERYLIGLGFTKEDIATAWKRSQTTIYTDSFTLEIITRDLLQRPKETEERIKQYKK